MKIQAGKLTPRHGVLIGVLIVTLYFVFPDDSKSNGSVSTGEQASQNGSDSPPDSSRPATKSSETAKATASIGSAEAISLSLQQTTEPLIALTEAQLQEVIAANPFFTSAFFALESPDDDAQATTAEIDSSGELRPEAIPLVEQLASAATVSLLYSSSRGSSVAVVNGQVIRPGESTTSGLRVESIDPRGIDVSAAPVTLP